MVEGDDEATADAGARDAAGAAEASLEALIAADAAGRLPPPRLPELAEAAYAAGRLDVTIDAWERLHAACLEAGDGVQAAGAAARVAMHMLFDTALLAPVRGWLARAERLLSGQPDAPPHAWIAVVRAYERLLGGDAAGARPWAERAVELGARFDPAACAIGRVASARLSILEGEVEEGLSLLDEVGAATVSGELDALSTGVVFCELVCALQGLAQYDRAEQWTEAMERWSSTHAVGSLHGRCRVHRAEILRLRGACERAEQEAQAACDELRPYLRRELGWPLSELGRIRLRMGDLRGAEQALLAAHHAGWDPQPELARLRLAEGSTPAAAEAIRDALERPVAVPSKERPPNHALQRAPLLEAAVEIEVAAGELGRARAAAEELEAIAERFGSSALAASAALARGRVSLAMGEPAEARAQLEAAVRGWSAIGAPYETAQARRVLAEALRATGAGEQAKLETDAAERTLAALGTAEGARGAGDGAEQTRGEGDAVKRTPAAGEGVAPPGAARASEAAAAGEALFRREGEVWSVAFAGETVRMRDLKGMRYLARLLAEPGRELHVLDLVAGERGESAGRGAAAGALGDAGELLDARARDAYRRRLQEIEADLEQAAADGDEARRAQAAVEREFLLRELTRAFGLGGRGRRAGSASERARAGATRAIRQAIAKLAEHHERLGAHLDRTVRTGTYCAYLPDPRAPIRWQR